VCAEASTALRAVDEIEDEEILKIIKYFSTNWKERAIIKTKAVNSPE
jgi:hypothetical protein